MMGFVSMMRKVTWSLIFSGAMPSNGPNSSACVCGVFVCIGRAMLSKYVITYIVLLCKFLHNHMFIFTSACFPVATRKENSHRPSAQITGRLGICAQLQQTKRKQCPDSC